MDANAGERKSKDCLVSIGYPFEVCDHDFKVKPVGPVCVFFPATFSCLGADMQKRDNLVSQHQVLSFLVPNLRYLTYVTS